MFQLLLNFLIDVYRLIVPLKPVFFHKVSICTTHLTNAHSKPAPRTSNQITVFGIETAFTTISPSVHKKFILNVSSLLEKSNNESSRLALAANAHSVAQGFIKECHTDSKEVELSNIIQVLTFRTLLQIFYPHVVRSFIEDNRFQSNTEVLLVSSKISSLWSLSKSPWAIFGAKWLPSKYSRIMGDRAILLGTLESQFPWYRDYLPQRNPLNVLIPAHLGMCELIFNCFVEVKRKSSAEQRERWEGLFRGFVKSLGEEMWRKEDEQGVSVEMLVVETLRLYPMAKEMYVQRADGGMNVVDIGALHRTGDAWGEHPEKFRPERWIGGKLDIIEMGYFMPIVRKEDGTEDSRDNSEGMDKTNGVPQLIALLVGVLLEALEGLGMDDECGMRDELSREVALRSDIDAYGNLRLKKRQ